MQTLFDPKVSRQTKRSTPHVKGYYTTKEAAEQLDVDPSTLRYRRDTADAKAYWDLLGVRENDNINELLARSHMIYDGNHYYEKKQFDKFVKLYLKRPEVIRARKNRTNFGAPRQPIMAHTFTSKAEVNQFVGALQNIIQTDGAVSVLVFDTND